MMELLERFVSAVEKIAAAMESRAVSIAVAAEVLEEHREAVSMAESAAEPELKHDASTNRLIRWFSR